MVNALRRRTNINLDVGGGAGGGFDPNAAAKGFRAGQQIAQQQANLDKADLDNEERELKTIGAAILPIDPNAPDAAAQLQAAMEGLERRRGVAPGTFSGRVTVADIPTIKAELEGAGNILVAERKRRQETARGGLTTAQSGRRNALLRGGASPQQADLIVGGVKAEEMPFFQSGGAQQAQATTPVSTGQPQQPIEDPRTARIRRETRAREQEKARVKRPKVFRAARGALQNFQSGGDVLETEIERAKDIITRNQTTILGIPINTAAGFGALLRALPESDAKALQSAFRTIRARIGFDELQKLRQASPTGGALGQVSDRENSLLQALQGDLDQAQRPEDLISVLDRIQTTRGEALTRLQDAFDQDFAEELGGQPAPQPTPAQGDGQQATNIGPANFATVEEATAAVQQGTIKSGDTVIIGGRRAVVGQ